jgi:hypothetical protein
VEIAFLTADELELARKEYDDDRLSLFESPDPSATSATSATSTATSTDRAVTGGELRQVWLMALEEADQVTGSLQDVDDLHWNDFPAVRDALSALRNYCAAARAMEQARSLQSSSSSSKSLMVPNKHLRESAQAMELLLLLPDNHHKPAANIR